MTSHIDPSKPRVGAAFTADMRANFFAAQTEIIALQEAVEALQGGGTSGGGDTSGLQTQIDELRADVDKLLARRMNAASITTPNPPNTSSATFVTAGIGVSFTPGSTRGIIHVQGQLGNTSNGQPAETQLVYGTGAAPAFGTPVSATNGVYVGGLAAMLAAKSNDFTPFALEALLESLTPGSQYWLGVAFRAPGGTATLSQMTLVAFEVLDPIP